MQEVDKALKSLNKLEESKQEEVGLQHALAWASVESVRAGVHRVNEQLTKGATRAQELYAAELAEAKANVDSLEANDAYQVITLGLGHWGTHVCKAPTDKMGSPSHDYACLRFRDHQKVECKKRFAKLVQSFLQVTSLMAGKSQHAKTAGA